MAWSGSWLWLRFCEATPVAYGAGFDFSRPVAAAAGLGRSHGPLRISHHVGSSACCDVSHSYFLTIPRSTHTHAAHRLPSRSHSPLRISHHAGSSACCDVSHPYFLTLPRSIRTHVAHGFPSHSQSPLRISHHVGSSAGCYFSCS